MYNFHKIRENSQESYFHHQHFDANNQEALAEIKRKPEKKKKKNTDSEDENSQVDTLKIKKIQKSTPYQTNSINYTPKFNSKQWLQQIISDKKVKSEKNTQNMF
jgi:hypothetical protein